MFCGDSIVTSKFCPKNFKGIGHAFSCRVVLWKWIFIILYVQAMCEGLPLAKLYNLIKFLIIKSLVWKEICQWRRFVKIQVVFSSI